MTIYRNENGQRVRLPQNPDDWCGDMSDYPLTDWELSQIAGGRAPTAWEPVVAVSPAVPPKPQLGGTWINMGRKAWCVATRGPVSVGDDIYVAGRNYFGQKGLKFGTLSYVVEILDHTDDGWTLVLIADQSEAGRRVTRYANAHKFDKKRG